MPEYKVHLQHYTALDLKKKSFLHLHDCVQQSEQLGVSKFYIASCSYVNLIFWRLMRGSNNIKKVGMMHFF